MIEQLYKNFIEKLKILYADGESTAIANIAFEHYTSLSAMDIILDKKRILIAETKSKLDGCLQRLLQHEPIQYIIENAWFYNIPFYVNKQVLIPRVETEELVLEAINYLKNVERKKVLDIGTGSGCIAIAIKKNMPETAVMAIDVSMDGLAVARKNAADNNVDIDFRQVDFLDENNYNQFEKFDCIISNPPYIHEQELVEKNVHLYEPHLALFVPQNEPLIFYKKIKTFCENHLEKNGKLFLEIHENLAKETTTLFLESNYDVTIKKDMQGKDRMLICRCL